jgi:glycerol-3-phosphate dehydrogenase
LEKDDVLGSFVGLRPLIKARPGQPSDLSREYRLWRGPTGLWSIAGGKYTTFRTMARHIVDRLAHQEAKAVRKHQPWRFDSTPDEPWPQFLDRVISDLERSWGLLPGAARHLVQRYGRRAFEVAAYLQNLPHGATPLCPGEPDLTVEIPYQRDHEMALFPADHFLRRTRLGLFRSELLTKWKDNAA